MAEAPPRPTSLLTIAGTVIGMLVGSASMYWSMRDRMEKDLKQQISVETRLSSLTEKVESLKSDVWTLQQRNP